MRSSVFFVIFVFCILKAFQLLNAFVFARLTSTEGGSQIMIGALVLIAVFSALSTLLKVFLPRLFSVSGMIGFLIFIVLSVFGVLDMVWTVTLLTTVFLYVLIISESQLLRSLNIEKKISPFVPFALSFLPVVAVYQLPVIEVTTPTIFYIVASILSLAASYSIKTYGDTGSYGSGDAPPLILGLLFLAMSGIAYYVAVYLNNETSAQILGTIMGFYAAGAAVTYMSLQDFLRRSRQRSG